MSTFAFFGIFLSPYQVPAIAAMGGISYIRLIPVFRATLRLFFSLVFG
jgi:hypothetical protein